MYNYWYFDRSAFAIKYFRFRSIDRVRLNIRSEHGPVTSRPVRILQNINNRRRERVLGERVEKKTNVNNFINVFAPRRGGPVGGEGGCCGNPQLRRKRNAVKN